MLSKEQDTPELLQPLSEEKDEVKTRSHLRRTLTKKAKRNILLVILGGLFLILLGITYGPQLLVQFSLLLEKDANQTEIVTKEAVYIAPPLLDPVPRATNSAKFTVTGTADNAEKVKIYHNGKVVGNPIVKNDASFSTSVTLAEGENEIKAKAIHQSGEQSTFSDPITLSYLKEQPKLTVTSPEDGAEFKGDDSPVTVQGTSENASRITINGFQAIISDSGSFSYNLPLKAGSNDIIVIAYNEAGNQTEQKITVGYQE